MPTQTGTSTSKNDEGRAHHPTDWLGSHLDLSHGSLHTLSSTVMRSINRLFHFLSYLNPFSYLFAIINSINRLFSSPHTHRSLLGSFILGSIVLLSLLISLVAYLSFYWAYVPHIGFSLPVWLQYGEARVPYAIVDFATQAPDIPLDQAYDVSLHLTVPTNDRNMHMGNFMVRLALVTAPPLNSTIHRSSRHASLVYEPTFARILHAFKHIRTLFFFSSPPCVQRLKVRLLEHRILQPSSLGKRARIAFARVDVGRQDVYGSASQLIERRGWGELQIYEAALVFDAHLEGLRWALYYHPYISFWFFSAFFFFTELAAVVCTWALVIYRTSTVGFPRAQPVIKSEEHSERMTAQPLPDDGQAESEPISRVGMTEVDESSDSEDDLRAVDDSDEPDLDPSPAQNLSVKPEADDDGVLVSGSQSTASSRSTATVIGSSTRPSRHAGTTDSSRHI